MILYMIKIQKLNLQKFKTDKDKTNKNNRTFKNIEMTSIKDFRKACQDNSKTINKQLELGFEDEESPYEFTILI